MTVGNFEFVRSEQPALAQLLCDAERWLDDDSSQKVFPAQLLQQLLQRHVAGHHRSAAVVRPGRLAPV